MSGRITLALSLTVNLGLLAWLGFLACHRSPVLSNPAVTTVLPIVPPSGPRPSPPSAVFGPARPPAFRWSEIESEDYATYIANLRRVGCPAKTIRDIILADVEKLYQPRLEALQLSDDRQFWRTAERREQARRGSNRRERELNREKRALIKRLLGLDYDQSALEAWWDEQEFAAMLGYLPEPKPVEVIAALNRFGEADNEIDDQAGGILTPEDVATKKSLFHGLLADLSQLLTPSQLEEAELRFVGAMSFELGGDFLAEPKLTGAELRELMRLKWQWASPLDEELEWPDGTFEQKRRRGQEEFVARARKLLGDDRIAVFLLEDDSDFKPLYDLAESQKLSHSAALQAYAIMKATTGEVTRVRRDRSLDASQRRAQVRDIRHEAEQALRQALGEQALAEYLEQDEARWLGAPENR